METAQEILKLIEAVDPSDTAKLDEIDARVACLLQDHVYGSEAARFLLKAFPQYTRSRDALKAIRPEGWAILIVQFENLFVCDMTHAKHFVGKKLPTEELAELHAIIQAIEYERGAK